MNKVVDYIKMYGSAQKPVSNKEIGAALKLLKRLSMVC